MDRRVWLQWMSRLLGLACAAVVVVPGVRYIIDPLRRKSAEAHDFKRLALLEDLPVDVPKNLPVMGSLQDAWTHYDEARIGDTWLVRRSGTDVPPEEAKVEAFNTICPHLGCNIQAGPGDNAFVCPCHNAKFKLDGAPIREKGYANPAPRGMDSLECRVVQDEASGQWWVEVTFTAGPIKESQGDRSQFRLAG